MKDQDSKDYFTRLIDILKRNGLEWVVSEVNTTIRLGKLKSKQLQVEEDLWAVSEERNVLENAGSRKKSRQKFTVSEPYTPQEELRILITAIESLTVDLAAVERRTAVFIERSGRKAQASGFSHGPEIVLYDENTDRAVWRSGSETRSKLTQLAMKISPVISELKQELDAS